MAIEGDKLRLTVKDRILLHLLDHAKFAGSVEVPLDMTQGGVATGVWTEPAHVAQYTRPLAKEGLIRERVAHVAGGRRRRKVYELTEAGRQAAIRLREKVKTELVRVRDANGLREATVSQVLQEIGGKASLLRILREATESGLVDLLSLGTTPPAHFVEMVAEAPRVEGFVGRAEELDSITKDFGVPRIFVVRGVAGIGKSSLAARACEFFRGRRNLFWHRVRPWDTHETILSNLGMFLAALGRPGLRSILAAGQIAHALDVLRRDLSHSESFLVFDDVHEATPEALAALRLVKDAVEGASDVRVLVLTREAVSFYGRRDTVLGGVSEVDLAGFEPVDVEAFLSGKGRQTVDLDKARQLGGHPLFLELLRSAADRDVPDSAFRHIEGYIEDEIYTKLSKAERKAMKMASLYRVPVPHQALIAEAGESFDPVRSLSRRLLIKSVTEGLECHDTVREFFAASMTQAERRKLAFVASNRLQELASKAREAGNLLRSINCLSNALQLTEAEAKRAAILEALGGDQLAIGDLPGALAAYREALRTTREKEIQARLHRKLAHAFEDRSELAKASWELDEGYRALGKLESAERAWLDLVKCRVEGWDPGQENARALAAASLRAFEQFGIALGQVDALVELAWLETYNEGGDPALAERQYETALERATSAGDGARVARIHVLLGDLYGHRFGDFDKALHHFEAAEAVPNASSDIRGRGIFLVSRAAVNLGREDYLAAARDYEEAIELGRGTYNRNLEFEARQGLAWTWYLQERIDEARTEFEKVAGEARADGRSWAAAANLVDAAECCLLQGDDEGLRDIIRAVAALELSQDFSRGEYDLRLPGLVRALQGLDSLLQGRWKESRNAFSAALRPVSSGSPLPRVLFYYGLALRAMGRRRESRDFIAQYVDLLVKEHNRGALRSLAEHERKIMKTLRRTTRSAR